MKQQSSPSWLSHLFQTLLILLLFVATPISPSFAQTDLSTFSQGKEAYQQGNYQEAITAFDQAITEKTNLEQAYYFRGVSYLELGELKNAIADETQVIELNPENAAAYYNRALADAYANRGVTRAAMGEKESAIADLEAAANLYQNQGNNSLYQTMVQTIDKLE